VQQTKQLRISSGTVKNKKLKTPEMPYFRPVQEVSKQAVFAILGEKTVDAQCLDLFAGSGNMGIEALSRGATWCDFVDNNKKANDIIEQNLFNCGFSDRGEIFYRDSLKYIQGLMEHEPDKRYDVIFADPFYEDTAQTHLLKQLSKVMNSDAVAVIFYGKQLNLEEILPETNLELVTTRRFGASHFSVLKSKP
jgi:16S rRNA (guanine966-N2)-methyltransferase